MANYIPTHHNNPQHPQQKHYDQQPYSRHYAASDACGRGRSWFVIPYSARSEYYLPRSIAHFTLLSNERPVTLFSPFFLAPATTYTQDPRAGAIGQSQRRLRRAEAARHGEG
jgi:hypothetical protein